MSSIIYGFHRIMKFKKLKVDDFIEKYNSVVLVCINVIIIFLFFKVLFQNKFIEELEVVEIGILFLAMIIINICYFVGLYKKNNKKKKSELKQSINPLIQDLIDEMKASDMVVVDLDGHIVEGSLKPSSDTPTHLVLYKAFPAIGGVVHTHSTYATSWAQAGIDLPNIGTTHADYFSGPIPCTRDMSQAEVEGAYEEETGNVIVERFRKLNPEYIPGVLVKNHGPFSWGKDAHEAVHHAVVMEQVAKMAFVALTVNPRLSMNPYLIQKHFFRKHGPNAYYGQ